jgi:hypothetical protein
VLYPVELRDRAFDAQAQRPPTGKCEYVTFNPEA